MGEVYVARHRHLGKDVAVKFLRRDLTSDDDAVTRFQREARAAAAVGHRGIVDVYDVGTASDGAPYIVMELLDGESMRALLDREKILPLDGLLPIVSELLAALMVAHAKGIVHRDLKPDNVFLERTDGPLSVKLLDFGVAKMTEGASVSLTHTGAAIGTAPYMSPEQARGVRDPDARVDVYAVGVILYESLTGCRPFESDSYNELMVKILREEAPALRSYRPDLPEAVEAVVMRALEKDPQRRFGSAADLLAALKTLTGLPESVPPRSTPSSGARLVVGGDATPADAAAATAATPVVTTAPPSRRARTLVFAGVAAVVIAALVIGSGSGRSSTTARPPPDRPATTRPEAPSAPAPPARDVAPAVVTIELEGLPDRARVFFDGALVSELPIRVAPQQAMVPLRVEAPGFETHSQIVSVAKSATVRVALRAAPSEPAAGKVVTPRGNARRMAATPLDPPATKIQTDTTEFEQ